MADSELNRLKDENEELKHKIEKLRGGGEEAEHKALAKCYDGEKNATPINLRTRRTLKGHFGKVYALHWSEDSKRIVSASQDGKLIIWHGPSTHKVEAIPLRSSWVMTCAFSPCGEFVACGGLDNLCSIYKIGNQQGPSVTPRPAHRELAQHEGYLSCTRFIDKTEIITSSGDSTCILWDIENKTVKRTFQDHSGDVMSVSIHDERNMFVSGSCDSTARIYDHRIGKCVSKYCGHQSDINSVQYFPDGQSFATGSDDSTCRFFDSRSLRQLNDYGTDEILCGITSVAFSRTGKYLFAGYDDYNCYIWDTLSGQKLQQVQGHENRVSCLGVNVTGGALCTGSWDTHLKIWA
uniref:Guanine nucleotide-binding protein subunit beta n=1 Tax=Hirondellea gigas TaxID=1518452 RepID=A0A6A7G9F2_9CRUS